MGEVPTPTVLLRHPTLSPLEPRREVQEFPKRVAHKRYPQGPKKARYTEPWPTGHLKADTSKTAQAVQPDRTLHKLHSPGQAVYFLLGHS